MNWRKLGLIFDLKKLNIGWIKTHAMTPTPIVIDNVIRVYFTGRSHNGESLISFADFDVNDPSKLVYVHDKPVMDIGGIGLYDDCGTICTCAVKENGKIYLYYTAYSVSFKVPYKNAIGLAISEDNGFTFKRAFQGPVLDRTKFEPYFVISPWALKHDDKWHMWYASGTEWILVNNKPESLYHIKYAYSPDGLNWTQNNQSCILPVNKNEANARPTVIADGEKLKMWFTYRGSHDFRDGVDSYRLGYAETDVDHPAKWNKIIRENILGSAIDGVDELMQAYPAVIKVNGKFLMYYNGNGFGVNGFCLAVADE